MKLCLRQWGLFLLLVPAIVLMGTGCAFFNDFKGPDEEKRTWVDVGEINKDIVKKKEQSAFVDVEKVETEKITKEDEVKVRDLSTRYGGDNPYLKSITSPEFDTSKTAQGEGILLNFDNADIYEVIQVVAEILDLNYIIDPQVKGTVNIRSGKKIPRDQLYVVFKKLLNLNGLDIKQEGGYDLISVSKKPIADAIYDAERMDELRDTSRMIMQVVPIMHLASSEAIKLVKPYLSEQGNSYDLVDQNTLIINDYESNLVDALSVLSRLDISPLASLKVRLIKVSKAPLFDLRDELMEILTSLKINKKGYDGITVLALERVNSLLLVSNNDFLLDTTLKWVEQLDRVPLQGRDSIFIYNVRNSVASELAALVNSLLEGDTTPKSTSASKTSTATTSTSQVRSTTASATTRTTKEKSLQEKSALRFSGQPTLLADDSRNIILIRAHTEDYNRLLKILERLDNLPRQVLIEVLVAEVKLSEGWEQGVEWSMKESGRLKLGDSSYNNEYITNWGQVPASSESGATIGFVYNVINSAGDAVGVISAIADDNEVSILSSPQVLVLNNEAATVNVGREVPIITSETINSSTSGTDNNTRTIQYKNTGVILTVTPRINYNGIIILEIQQEVSSATKNTTGGLDTPEISTRKLETKLAVKDSQTILMGGLIEQTKNNVENGIPFIKDVPILGWLFKYQSEEVIKTELVVMITPYVIESEDVLDQYIQKFKEKSAKLKKELTD